MVNYYANLKKKAIFNLKYILNNSLAYQKEVELAENNQLDFLKPQSYRSDNPKNAVREMEISFENMCTTLEQNGINSPKSLTVFTFYSKIAYFKGKKTPE